MDCYLVQWWETFNYRQSYLTREFYQPTIRRCIKELLPTHYPTLKAVLPTNQWMVNFRWMQTRGSYTVPWCSGSLYQIECVYTSSQLGMHVCFYFLSSYGLYTAYNVHLFIMDILPFVCVWYEMKMRISICMNPILVLEIRKKKSSLGGMENFGKSKSTFHCILFWGGQKIWQMNYIPLHIVTSAKGKKNANSISWTESTKFVTRTLQLVFHDTDSTEFLTRTKIALT
jgi:hypothetical protein